MAASRVSAEDAQEMREALQQAGDGWFRQVALAIKMGAHKSLGMERREFVASIGQRLIDPRPAIVELHRAGHSMAEIADVLSVDRATTVRKALVDAGLVVGNQQDGEAEPVGDQQVIEGTAVDVPEPKPKPKPKPLPPDLEEAVGNGKVERDEAEVIAEQNSQRMDAYAQDVRTWLQGLGRMVGYPVTDGLRTRLTPKEMEVLTTVLTAMEKVKVK